MRHRWWTGILLAAALTVPAGGAPLKISTAALGFGLRPTVIQASLSPDGTMLATVEPDGAHGNVLRILDLKDPASQPQRVMVSTGEPERINWCNWVGPKRLLCLIYGIVSLNEVGEISYVTRLVGVDSDAQNVQALRAPGKQGQTISYNLYAGDVIDWDTGQDGHIYLSRSYPRTLGGNEKYGLAVDDVDTSNLFTKSVEAPRSNAIDFISDGTGKVRMMGIDTKQNTNGVTTGLTNYLYRKKGEVTWLPFGTMDGIKREGFNPFLIDPTLDVVYGLKKLDGRMAAYSISLDGTAKEALLASRPDVDIGGFVTIGRKRRVIGIRYTTDRDMVDYIDPKYKSLAARLSKALPDLPLVRFVDSSEDENKLLLWTGSDVDPGRYYVLDRKTGGMTEVAHSRRPLAGVPLGKVKSVTIPTADGVNIPAYLTLPPGSDGKNLPAIVMPHGGPEARDDWGFDWLAQFWASIGYAVLQPNFRGSAGYGDDWIQKNGFKSWKTAIGDVATSGRWMIKEGIADPNKLAIFGWSYGGYAALQTPETEPGLFRAAIAVAPVTDLGRLKEEFRNWSNFYANAEYIGGSDIVESGSPARHADKMTVPVLMFHGSYDRNVSYKQSKLMDERMKAAGKDSTLVLYDKLDHQLDDSGIRQDMLQRSAEFLQAVFATPK